MKMGGEHVLKIAKSQINWPRPKGRTGSQQDLVGRGANREGTATT